MTFRYITPEAVVSSRLAGRPLPDWSAAVLCFRDYKGSQILVRQLNAEPIGHKVLYGLDEFADGPFVFQAAVNGKSIGIVTRCNWGGPQAAILVEELAAIGVPYVIGYGAGGAICSDLPRGAQVVAASAIPGDGTSRAYGRDAGALLPDLSLAALAIKAGCALSCEVQSITVATVDALYRETE